MAKPRKVPLGTGLAGKAKAAIIKKKVKQQQALDKIMSGIKKQTGG